MTEQTEITEHTEQEFDYILPGLCVPLFPFVPSSLFCFLKQIVEVA